MQKEKILVGCLQNESCKRSKNAWLTTKGLRGLVVLLEGRKVDAFWKVVEGAIKEVGFAKGFELKAPVVAVVCENGLCADGGI